VAAPRPATGRVTARRSLIGLAGVAIVVLAIFSASSIGTLLPGGAAAATPSPDGSEGGLASAQPTPPSSQSPGPTLQPTPVPPTPEPTPVTVPAPLTGLPVSEAAARQHPIAAMIDDHPDARPQSGFNRASVVWHAPAEGGVPRYMLVFQERLPDDLGPVRSARQYYVEWAAEWRALYVHAGGSPQAIATLRARGDGEWVYDADEFRWGGIYLFRATDRFAPHNVYTDGMHLRQLMDRLGAEDGPIEPAWSFRAERPVEQRPIGGRIRVHYKYNTVTYRYDRKTNRYVRSVDDGTNKAQVDRADGKIVAPKNVVILRMRFGPLLDSNPSKGRLEAENVGTGEAWVSSNGVTIKAEWRKAAPKAPTLLFNLDGTPLVLTAGQTFIQVLPLENAFEIDDGPAPVFVPPQHWDD
jgi:hypothetical protein